MSRSTEALNRLYRRQLTPAERLETIVQLASPVPKYCECKDDCDVVLSYSKPLLSNEEALVLLTEWKNE